MKIFIDVGGNVGQTIAETLRPIYRFDVIHSLEPQLGCYQELSKKFNDKRLVLHNFGLADFDGSKNLYGTGIGASIFSDKDDIDNSHSEECRFVRATNFLDQYISKDDIVMMKLNCEGSEILILHDLIQNDRIHLLSHILIDFDIRKIPSQQQKEEEIRSELATVDFKNYIVAKEIRWGFTYRERVWFWLSLTPDAEEIMELTTWQKIIRCLPFGLVNYICRKIRKMFYKICGNYPSRFS